MQLPARFQRYNRRTPSALDGPLKALVVSSALFPCLLLIGAVAFGASLEPLVLLLLAMGWSTLLFQHAEDEHLQSADLIARCAVFAGCAYFAWGSPYWIATLLTAGAVLNVRHHEADSNVIAGVFLGGLATVSIAAREGGLAGVLIAFPAIAIAMVGLLWTQARLSRRRVRRTLRGHQEEEGPQGLRGRVLLGCALAILLILVLPASVQITSSAQNLLRSMAGLGGGDDASSIESGLGGEGARDPQDGESTSDPEQTDAEDADAPPPRRAQSFPNALGFEGQTSLVPHPRSKRLELRVLRPEERQRYFSETRPAYLRITSFDGFGQEGLLPAEHEAVYTYNDYGDGFNDRWTRVVNDPLRGIALDLELRMTPILAPGRRGQLAIPRIEPVIAVRREEVQHSESGMLSIPDDGMGLHVVQYRTRVPEVLARDLVNPRFDLSDERYLALPESEAWQPVMEELARQLAGMQREGQPLREVAAHFKRNYRYSLEAPDPGLRGLAKFLDEKSGYCTYFATSAMLMLRMQGVPARVAAGYRVTDYDEEAEAYVAGDQVAHAWVEVRTSWHGWIPVEPTPAASLADALLAEGQRIARAEAAALEQLALEEAAAEAEAAANMPSGESEETGAVAQAEQDSTPPSNPDSASDEVTNEGRSLFGGRLPAWLIYALVSAFIANLIQLAFNNRTRDDDGGLDPLGFDDPSLLEDPRYRRVLEVFLELGFALGGRRTPMEFAVRQVEVRGTSYSPLLPITRMLYARRYGGHPMGGPTWQRFEQFETRLSEMDLD